MEFKDNFTCFCWLFDFISPTEIQDEYRRQNQIISVKETTFTTISATTVQPQVQSVTIYHLIRDHLSPYQNISLKKTSVAETRGEKTEAEKLEDCTTDKNQDIYSYHNRLNAEPTQNTYIITIPYLNNNAQSKGIFQMK